MSDSMLVSNSKILGMTSAKLEELLMSSNQ